MAKLNVTYPAVNVLVNGVEYRKVDRKAQAGDIVKMLEADIDVETGAFYNLADGSATHFMDDDHDPRLLNGWEHEVYAPVSAESDTITFEGAAYRKVARIASVGDVIVFTDGAQLPSYLTLGRPYVVTEIDSVDDAQITDDDGDDYDTCGKTFDVYEKVAEAAQQYREVSRKASVGERIKIVDKDPFERNYKNGAEFVVNRADSDGDVYVNCAGDDEYYVLRSEYVVLEPDDAYVHSGVTYRKESRVANVGEIVLVVANTMIGNKHGYKIGEVTEIVGEWLAGSYGPQRKGSGKSGPYLATADYVVLVPTDKPEEPTPYSAGDYVKVTGNSVHHNYEIGSVVKIAQITAKDTDGNDEFRAEKADGSIGNYIRVSECEPATETEFLAQKKPKDPRDAFAKGDKVRLISGGETSGLCDYATGGVYTVNAPKSPYDNGKVQITGGGQRYGYAKPEELEKLTAEEASAIEKERVETEKWAKIGRKVNEYKTGDIVQYVTAGYSAVVPVIEVVSDGVKVKTVDYGVCTERYDSVKLIVPVEQRFDKTEAA
ncbi:hypothetical protein G5B47_02330 [Paenibacillus sp. 7124]|uniref:Uncharacterized protein n=1 Tax=Paenibacillus apii TaxID=1850370 RepID=A0A6M1PG77_9BACL|nr:hypothetical protein [Paenibacillus apii]NGM81245.1 hypothetical protein [Paenibacillus apii]